MALSRKDVKLPEKYPRELLLDKHAEFISKYGNDPNDYEYAMSEFLRDEHVIDTLGPAFFE